MEHKLREVRARKWFYEFELPDGSKTDCDIPDAVQGIHRSRRIKLHDVVDRYVPNATTLTALDLASHEGFFSVELAKRFAHVRGLDYNLESIAAANLMAEVLAIDNIVYEHSDLTRQEYEDRLMADFVLVYGLLYHLENPVHVIRLACALSRKHILIETQIFPYDIQGRIEDGHFTWQREVQGVFSLSIDYADRREGGSTDIALVPSLNALVFLLRNFGFSRIVVMDPIANDYEQFSRGARVVVYAAREDP